MATLRIVWPCDEVLGQDSTAAGLPGSLDHERIPERDLGHSAGVDSGESHKHVHLDDVEFGHSADGRNGSQRR